MRPDRLGWVLSLVLLAACTSRAPESGARSDDSVAAAEVTADAIPDPPALNLRCRTDADCAVKNIGNCCGFLPACVHKASPTAPDLILARCAGSGEEPVCDHPMIYACLCEQGICRADPSVGSPVE